MKISLIAFTFMMFLGISSFADSGSGNYYCVQTAAEQNAIYLITSLSGRWNNVAKVTASEGIKDAELKKITEISDDIFEDVARGKRRIPEDGKFRFNSYTVELVASGSSFKFGQAVKEGYNYQISYGMNNAFTIYSLREGNPAFNWGAIISVEPNQAFESRPDSLLGAKKPVNGFSYFDLGKTVPSAITIRYCNYIHES